MNMINRSIACLLSLTLVFNSFAPSIAYAVNEDESSTEQAFTEEEVLSDGDSESDFDTDSQHLFLSDGVSGGEEQSQVNRKSLTPEELDAQTSLITAEAAGKTRAIPAVVLWLGAQIGSTVVGYAITSLLESGKTDTTSQQIALLYGIQAALIDSNGNSVFSLLNRVTNYLSNTYYLLDDVYDSLVYTRDGSSHSAGSSLFYIHDLLKYTLWYTNEDGRFVSIGEFLDNQLSGIQDIQSWGKAFFTEGDDGVYYTVGDFLQAQLRILQDIQTWGHGFFFHDGNGRYYSVGEQLFLLLEAIENLNIELSLPEDFEIKIPELDITVTPEEQISSSVDFWTLLFGALEFAMIASSLDDLGDTLETTFPFCLVPGFVALLGLLQAEPVAPSFDFPVPDGVGGTLIYKVDLSAFDSVAEVFRVLIFVTYCIGLIFVTRNFIFKGGAND